MASTRATATRTAARLVVAGSAVATLALVAGPAVAAPATSHGASTTTTSTAPGTTAAITAAVQRSPATAGVPGTGYAVTDVRTAATDATWAGAALQPTGDDLDPATVVLHRVRGTWTVVDLGTAQVGCGTAPATVVTDLGLDC